jgi:hypothetical protein
VRLRFCLLTGGAQAALNLLAVVLFLLASLMYNSEYYNNRPSNSKTQFWAELLMTVTCSPPSISALSCGFLLFSLSFCSLPRFVSLSAFCRS